MRIDPTVYTARPKDPRLPREEAVYDLLEALSIPFARADHEAAASVEDCLDAKRALGVDICKNLFLTNRQKTQFYLLMMPGEKPFYTKELSAQLGVSRLSFAGTEEMETLLGVSPGSVTVLALMNDREGRVRLLMDRDVAEQECLGCHPCVNTSSLRLRTADVLDRFLPAVGHAPTLVTLGNSTE